MIKLAVVYFIAVIALAHFFTPPEYHWTQNTISDLAAQGLKNQWIMQAGFIGFGLLLNLGFILKFIAAQKITYPDLLIMFYGLAIVVTGFFSTEPFLQGARFSAQESSIHSIFATAAGVSLSLGIGYRLLTAAGAGERWQHGVFLALVMGISLLFGLSENGMLPAAKGIVQRMLYLVSFIWMFVSL